ncbi:10039_t:CDS:10 [Acaulospora morrowiae]|uniref:10039_t:CDS:1 n=1 Tax=Acaulospora morrowiae TaxID=94023 RepID=A0A9N9BII4_9GLOM|nr:10039_t:CDS:10 [Acaulospora morrowiae]
MNSGINLTTNAKELKSSYQSVLEGKEVNWVVYGYERGNELKVVSKGDGGLEELKDEFDEGKIQYAFARVIDPNSELPKLVLIGWCGEGVPNFKKGFFNSHFNEVTKFLKGYHLQINARSEEDVDPDYIMKRINESGGSKYMANINKNAPVKKDEPILPVRSVYQPEKIPDIAALQKSVRQEPILPVRSTYQPEKIPDIVSLQKTASKEKEEEEEEIVRSSYQPEKIPDIAALQKTAPKDDIKPVVRNLFVQHIYNHGAQNFVVLNLKSSVYKPVQLPKPKRLGTRATWITEENNPPTSGIDVRREREEREKKEHEREERERKERERKEREKKERERAERERIEQEDDERREQERLEQEEYEREESERAEREEHERAQRLRQQKEADNQEEEELERQRKEEEEAYRRQEEESLLQEAQSNEPEPAGTYFARALYEYDAAEDNEMSLVEGEIIKDIVQLDEGWWQGTSEDGTRSGLFPANFVELIEAEIQNPEEETELELEPEPQETHEQSALPSAKAVYDYEAGESNEISFVEGDIITNIDFVSDDWWQGTAQDGSVGLFPANYVELLG